MKRSTEVYYKNKEIKEKHIQNDRKIRNFMRKSYKIFFPVGCTIQYKERDCEKTTSYHTRQGEVFQITDDLIFIRDARGFKYSFGINDVVSGHVKELRLCQQL
jgi:hypothetical protein